MNQRFKDKKIKILLIDDDAEERLLLEEFLLRSGDAEEFKLNFSDRLESGLEYLSQNGADIILLDLHLPDSKGIETFLKLNRHVPDIPIVILSVLYDDALAVQAVRRGAQDYLYKKQITRELLMKTIRFAVERHRLRRELDKAKLRLEKLALIDPVTELFNKRGLEEILSHEYQRSRRKHSNLLVLLVDLDDFQKINNALGNTVGDVILKEVAYKLKASLRATDYVGRVGGDEFMVLLPETRAAEGMRVAEKIRMAVSTTSISMTKAEPVKITASLGLINIATLEMPPQSCSISEVISRIHLLLYKSKQSGKNRVSCDDYHGTYRPEISGLLSEEKHFYALMQPIFHLSNFTEIGYEFLSRSLIKGFEMPDDFFRASLEANMLMKVDHGCLKACVTSSHGVPEGSICHVNLFPSTIIGLPVQKLIETFSRAGSKLQKPRYCLEISEQQIIGDPSYLIEPVAALKRAGVSIAIDDLGFGRSCLESLILLEPNIVKIDKRCVTGVSRDPAASRSLKRLLKMAKSLGAEVVAEGIETKEDFDFLKELGVKYGQGYFLGRPGPSLSNQAGQELAG